MRPIRRDYPKEFQSLLPMIQAVDATRPGLNITAAGYGFSTGDLTYPRGYYAAALRQRFDFQDDALGRDTTITYDSCGLLPVEVIDPAGLRTQATHDYRVLQPREIIDPNGNH